MHPELEQPISRYEKIWDAITGLQLNIKDVSKDTAFLAKEMNRILVAVEEIEKKTEQMFNTFSMAKGSWLVVSFLVGLTPIIADLAFKYLLH